jgi:hypothetical protein
LTETVFTSTSSSSSSKKGYIQRKDTPYQSSKLLHHHLCLYLPFPIRLDRHLDDNGVETVIDVDEI